MVVRRPAARRPRSPVGVVDGQSAGTVHLDRSRRFALRLRLTFTARLLDLICRVQLGDPGSGTTSCFLWWDPVAAGSASRCLCASGGTDARLRPRPSLVPARSTWVGVAPVHCRGPARRPFQVVSACRGAAADAAIRSPAPAGHLALRRHDPRGSYLRVPCAVAGLKNDDDRVVAGRYVLPGRRTPARARRSVRPHPATCETVRSVRSE